MQDWQSRDTVPIDRQPSCWALSAGIAGMARAASTQRALLSVLPYQFTATELEQVLVPASHTW